MIVLFYTIVFVIGIMCVARRGGYCTVYSI